MDEKTHEGPPKQPGVYTRLLAVDDLVELLAVLRPHAPFAILERVDVPPDFPAADEPLSPTTWPTGRVFGPDFELRWERSGESFRLFFTGEQEPAPEWERSLDLTGCRASQRSYYLWGPGNVALGRDPHYRAMPPGKGRPQLAVVEYHDGVDGRFVLARYSRMQREATP